MLDKGTEFHVVLDLEIAENRDDEMVLPNWRMLAEDNELNWAEYCHLSPLPLGERRRFMLCGLLMLGRDICIS